MNKQEMLDRIKQQREDRLEAERRYEEMVPARGFDRVSDEVDAMKHAGIYCGSCGHGNGCEHGVPESTVRLDRLEAKVKNDPDRMQYRKDF